MTSAKDYGFPYELALIPLGVWGLYDFRKGRAWGRGEFYRKDSPVLFWFSHTVIQLIIVTSLCLPWIDRIGK